MSMKKGSTFSLQQYYLDSLVIEIFSNFSKSNIHNLLSPTNYKFSYFDNKASTYNQKQNQNLLKSSLASCRNTRINSHFFKKTDPILQKDTEEKKFISSSKRTQLSGKSNIFADNDYLHGNEGERKFCLKKVEVKPQKLECHKQFFDNTRQLHPAQNSLKPSRNPIIDGDEFSVNKIYPIQSNIAKEQLYMSMTRQVMYDSNRSPIKNYSKN